MNKLIYKRILRETGALNFAVGSPSALAAALIINQDLPILQLEKDNHSFDFIQYWSTEIMPIAKKKVEELSNEYMVDKTMTLELTRLVYKKRHRIANDPLFVVFQLLSPEQYADFFEESEMTYSGNYIYSQAFYYIVEVMHSNRKEMSAAFNSVMGLRNKTRFVNMITDKIYDTFDATLRQVPPGTMAKYHSVIHKVVSDVTRLYAANGEFSETTNPDNALLLEDIIGDTTNNTLNMDQKAAFLNVFYGRDIVKKSPASPSPSEEMTGAKEVMDYVKEVAEVSAESMDESLFDTMSEELQSNFSQIANASEYVNTIMQQGACRSDAIVLLGLDPIKDKGVLAKYPLERSGSHQEIAMGLFSGLKAIGRGMLKIAARIVESILNKIFSLLGSPFDFEPRIVLTDKTDLLVEWGKTFNTGLHDQIEEGNSMIKDPAGTRDLVQGLCNSLTEFTNHLSQSGLSIDKAMSSNVPSEQNDELKRLNREGMEIIKAFNDSIVASGVFSEFMVSRPSSNGFDVQEDELRKQGTMAAIEITKTGLDNIRTLNKQAVKQRVATIPQIEKLVNGPIKAEDLERISEEMADFAKVSRVEVAKLKGLSFDFVDKKNLRRVDEDQQAFMVEENKLRYSFALQTEVLKDMGMMVNRICQAFHTVAHEAASMIVTYKAIDGK